MAIRTYVDSNVLINAYKGELDLKRRARAVLFDPDREFVTSGESGNSTSGPLS